MEFSTRLPRSLKETALFIAVISIISVNIIAPIITGFEIGFSMQHWVGTLRVLPFIWICVVLLVLATDKPVAWMASYFLDQGDSFKATMLVTALCNVFLMSIFLTVIGSWIGGGQITMDPIVHFFEKWPRNFAIALLVESLIAQPIARSVMALIHRESAVEAD